MNCPHDNRPLSINERYAYSRHECRKCGGMLIEAAFLAHALSKMKNPGAEPPDLLKLPEGQVECPRDGRRMRALLHDDVEIDICPECRSVWLDRGEYDKVVSAGPKKDKARARDDTRGITDALPDVDTDTDLEDVADFIGGAVDVVSGLLSP